MTTERDAVVAAHVAVAGDRLGHSERVVVRLFWLVAIGVLGLAMIVAGYTIVTIGGASTRSQAEDLGDAQRELAEAVRELQTSVDFLGARTAIIERYGESLDAQVTCLRTGERCP